MKNGIVSNWMTAPAVSVTPEAHLVDARRIMDIKKIRALPVVSDNQVVGIVTRRGLLRTDFAATNSDAWIANVDVRDERIDDVMTANPITILPNSSLPKAARVMMENKITALPVVNNKSLKGILTASDIFRFIIDELPDLRESLLVEDYMTDEVVTITADTSLLEAHRLMGTRRIRALPVMDGIQLIGLVTRTDLMGSDPSRFSSRNNQELSLKILTQSVEKIMTRELLTIGPEEPIQKAASLMLENKIHCLPVTDAKGNLVGILTETDLFRMVIQKFS